MKSALYLDYICECYYEWQLEMHGIGISADTSGIGNFQYW